MTGGVPVPTTACIGSSKGGSASVIVCSAEALQRWRRTRRKCATETQRHRESRKFEVRSTKRPVEARTIRCSDFVLQTCVLCVSVAVFLRVLCILCDLHSPNSGFTFRTAARYVVRGLVFSSPSSE